MQGQKQSGIDPHHRRTHAALDKIFAKIKEQDDQVQAMAVCQLQEFVDAEATELSSESLIPFQRMVNQRLQELFRAPARSRDGGQNLCIAGIKCIAALIDVDFNEPMLKITQFANYVSKALNTDDHRQAELAAETLGKIVRIESPLTHDIVEAEAKRCLEWISGEGQGGTRRYVGALVMRELVLAVPHLLFQRLGGFLVHIWFALRDEDIAVRRVAATALRALVLCVDQRGAADGEHAFRAQSIEGLLRNCVETVHCHEAMAHGALLALQEIYLHSREPVLHTGFPKLCETVLNLKSVASSLSVCREVIVLLPVLAQFNPSAFLPFLPTVLSFFSDQLKGPERGVALECVGRVVETLCPEDHPTVEQVLRFLHLAVAIITGHPEGCAAQVDRMDMKPRGERDKRNSYSIRSPPDAVEAVSCVASIAKAIPDDSELRRQVFDRDFIDQLFSLSLELKLVEHLAKLSHAIPPLLTVFQERILDRLSRILINRPYEVFGTPSSHHGEVSIKGNPTDKLVALKTLGAFDMTGHDLTSYTFTCIVPFLRHPDTAIRREAVLKCCKLIKNSIEYYRQLLDELMNSGGCRGVTANACTHKGKVLTVLHAVISLGVSDTDNEIRLCVLHELQRTADFDPFIATPDCTRTLVISMNDEWFKVREVAVSVIGRLSHLNPAHTLPALRRVLLQLLLELQCTTDAKQQDQAAVMLGRLILAAQQLIEPYVVSLLQVIISKLQNGNRRIHGSLLETLGILTEAAGKEAASNPLLIPLTIKTLSDRPTVHSSHQAVVALGRIMRNSGKVNLLEESPSFLDKLIDMLQGASKEPISTRLEVARTLGIMGAIDPYTLQQLRKAGTEKKQGGRGSQSRARLPSAFDSSYDSHAVVVALLSIVEQPSLSMHHRSAVQALQMILRALKTERTIAFLPQILPTFLRLLKDCRTPDSGKLRDKSFAEFMLRAISNVVSVVQQHIRKYQGDIIGVAQEFWDTGEPQVLSMIISICEELGKALNEEFLSHLAWVVPQMIRVISNDPTPDRLLSCKAVGAFEVFGQLLDTYMHLVVPCLATTYGSEDHPSTLRVAALRTMKSLMQKLNLRLHSSKVVHSILRVLHEPAPHEVSPFAGAAVDSPKASILNTSALDMSIGEKRSGTIVKAKSVVTSVHTEALSVLEALVHNIRDDFEHFFPVVRHTLETAQSFSTQNIVFNPRAHIDHLSALLHKVKHAPGELDQAAVHHDRAALTSSMQTKDQSRQHSTPNQTSLETLRRSWQVVGAFTARDYVSWLAQFGQTLLQESPSPSLRAAFDISRQYPQLNQELFNAAFMTCYVSLNDEYKREMLKAMQTALKVENLPGEVLQPLLNLAEFMERCDQQTTSPFFFTPKQLAHLAERCQLYAKALHYKETEVRQIEVEQRLTDPEDWPLEAKKKCLEACRGLVQISNCLELPESAEGLLTFIQKNNLDQGSGLSADMCEKLGWWDKAFNIYNEMPPGEDVLEGRFRCLDQMGDWPLILALAREHWPTATDEMRSRTAPMVAHAAWLMSNWDVMAEATEKMSSLGHVGHTAVFYRAVMALHHGQHEECLEHIQTCRSLMDKDVCTQIAESYNRAYELIVCLQQLSELEEISMYAKTDDDKKREVLRMMWEERTKKMSRDPKYLQGTLALRSLVIPPSANLPSWLDFVETCRWAGKDLKALRVLLKLLGWDYTEAAQGLSFLSPICQDTTANPLIVLALLEHLWAVNASDSDARQEIHVHLNTFTQAYLTRSEKSGTIQGRCHLLMALWQQHLQSDDFYLASKREKILTNLEQAVILDGNSYTAWHEWALMNYRVSLRDEDLHQKDEVTFVTRAIEGFTKSISLCHPSELAVQDILRLLRIWFNFGGDPAVECAVKEGVDQIRVEMWLQVIPQIIARIDSPEEPIRRSIHELLLRIAEAHPQALVYPLAVCTCSPPQDKEPAAGGGEERRLCASKVLDKVREKFPRLVGQAELVAAELIRVAILWSEKWMDALEAASQLFFVDNDPAAMIEVLSPLHRELRNTETGNEVHFKQVYGRDLEEAHRATDQWKTTKKQSDMTQAWDIYYNVFRQLQRQLNQMLSIELQNVSKKLYEATDFEVAVPGQYQAAKTPVCIKSFAPTLEVISSKQRPRKLTMIGSDGQPYKFLLKGREDLRQDERVMQLFGLVNTLLKYDQFITAAARADLTIEQYPVIPLSNNAGIIGWLGNAETLHTLIRDYRERHEIVLNVETIKMKELAGDPDLLSSMQKVEAFEYALANTSGDDVNKILWFKSANSEVWLDRRMNFTRSLATMSMVGYILGLGDRH
eukprot:Sspe_Gene.40257::Locus_19427_Transcript_1_1_Confidence_1.000_Length_7027::g.40257::m.40257/K07203/MTOR, FRAP, TOR; serine/threonine-protein kinase mTOR